MLRNSDMVMYDRQTESWWQQLTGEGLAGEMNGQKLDFITAPVISIEEFALFFPDGQVLSKNNGLVNKDGTQKNYDTNPYQGYDSDDTPFLFDGKIDERLPPMERVVDIIIHGQHKIYPNTALFEEKVINDKFEGEHITLFSTHKIISVLDSTEIKKSRTVGGVAAYYSDLDGKTLTFTAKEEGLFTDDQTKSVWNVKGQCIQGKLKGNRLRMIVHGNHFAFAMLAFYPNCQIFGLD
jgi:hypothetical protein